MHAYIRTISELASSTADVQPDWRTSDHALPPDRKHAVNLKFHVCFYVCDTFALLLLDRSIATTVHTTTRTTSFLVTWFRDIVVDPVLKVPSVHVSHFDFVNIYSATPVQYRDNFFLHTCAFSCHHGIDGHGD
jgi:hypothetical protein